MINSALLSRRQLLKTGTLGTFALLSGCEYSKLSRSTLLYSRGSLPYQWLKLLPNDWRSDSMVNSSEVVNRILSSHPDLVQVSDAWGQLLNPNDLAPLDTIPLFKELALFTEPITYIFKDDLLRKVALPIAFSPWLLVICNRPDLLARSSEGWHLLLDPTVRGRVVFPSSPRVLIDIAQRLEGGLETLPALRRSVLSFDRYYGLNLLLNGDAEISILPAREAIPLLQEHPHLKGLLPNQGTILTWDLLVRPLLSQKALPIAWIQEAWKRPLLDHLIANGWVPPLPRARLQGALDKLKLPPEWKELLYPEESLLNKCSSLLPLDINERKRLQDIWTSVMV
uniref:Periplasmic binding protein-like II superfamily n=1 Tax=Paulinella micropora TaxID=1928728 RepID=A0A385I153_9EUKA|nr:hypothetical protein PMNZ_731 [Paulinella micropora]AXY63652.1 hypothetical protein PMNZ_731 [Paulinella micropora]